MKEIEIMLIMIAICFLRKLLKITSDVINKISLVLVVVFLSAMVIIVLLQVFFRFILNNALPWPEEISRYLMVWGTFLGSGIACKYESHIGLSFIRERINAKYQGIIEFFVNCCILLFLAVCIWKGIIIFKFTLKQISPSAHISMAWPYSSVPICSAIMFIHILNSFFERNASLNTRKWLKH